MSFKRSPRWKIYRDQMSQLDYGDPLWDPSPLKYFERIRLADVGYVRRGCFNLLFSAGEPLGERKLGVDVPPTFQSLDVGPTLNPQPRLPGCLSINTVREAGANLATSISGLPMLEPGFNVSFELSEKQGAALVTKYSTYSEDIQREQIFEEYTRRHYDSWVAFASKGGHGNDIRPVLVTGVDMTRDFAMMCYLNNGVNAKSDFTASAPGVASVSASAWGTWRTEGLVHTNCGPQLCIPPSSIKSSDLGVSQTEPVSEEYNQCVFIRYYTMRKLSFLFPRVIKAAAGPRDLGAGDRDNEEPPALEVQYDSDDASLPSGDDGEEGSSSLTHLDSNSNEVFQNTTYDESDDFDVIAEYIFQNSSAESVLLHHRDIALLRKIGGSKNVPAQLLEKQPRIIVDKNRVAKIDHDANPSTTPSSYKLSYKRKVQYASNYVPYKTPEEREDDHTSRSTSNLATSLANLLAKKAKTIIPICPNCKGPVSSNPVTGKYYDYCTKTCADQARDIGQNSTGGQSMCNYCGRRPKYSDGGKVHPYCGRRCAGLAKSAPAFSSTTPQKSSPDSTCQNSGCTSPVFANPDGSPGGYCEMIHKQRRNVLRTGPVLIKVSEEHQDYKSVESKFKASWRYRNTCPEVRAVYKIINTEASVKKYEEYLVNVEARGGFTAMGKARGNQSRRWHGTRRACNIGDNGVTDFCQDQNCSLCSIIKTSFDVMSFKGTTNRGRFGRGIYTSSFSSKSDIYSHNDGIPSDWKALLLNKVVVGTGMKMIQDDPSLTKPPAGYDSVLEGVVLGGSLHYDDVVVYSSDAIRPSYLVMYEEP